MQLRPGPIRFPASPWLVVALAAAFGLSAWHLDTPWKAERRESLEPTLAERVWRAERGLPALDGREAQPSSR